MEEAGQGEDFTLLPNLHINKIGCGLWKAFLMIL